MGNTQRMLNENQIHRISFAKLLFEQGLDKCKMPNPHDSISILHLHDSVDVYIQLLAEIYNCKPQKNSPSLIDLANAVNPKLIEQNKEKLNISLLNRLNTARNKLKHETIFLNQIDILGFVSEIKNFFIENTPKYFHGLRFESISLVFLIKQENVKLPLSDANNNIKMKEYRKALENINLAFGHLINNLKTYKTERGTRGQLIPSNWFRSISQSYRTSGNKLDISGFKEFEKGLKESFDSLSELIVLTNLGINIQDYSKFKKYRLYGYMSTDYEYTVIGEYKNEISEEEIEYCFNFVLQTALKQ